MAADGFVSLSRPDAGFNLIFLRTGLPTFKPAALAGLEFTTPIETEVQLVAWVWTAGPGRRLKLATAGPLSG